MCSRWTGALSAAIIADGGGCISRHMRRKVSALHSRVESGGSCRLDISLCRESPGLAAGDGLYPVNSLRNVALRAAGTDLVLSLVSGERFCFAHCGVVLPSFHANFLRCIHSPETNLAMQNDASLNNVRLFALGHRQFAYGGSARGCFLSSGVRATPSAVPRRRLS